MTTVQAVCPAQYSIESGSCVWIPYDGPPGFIYYNGPRGDGLGWVCTGTVYPVGGQTCHYARFRINNAICVPSCSATQPSPSGALVYQGPAGCDNRLTPESYCYTEKCRNLPDGSGYGNWQWSGKHKDCLGGCAFPSRSLPQYCPTTSINRHLKIGNGAVPVYLKAGGCDLIDERGSNFKPQYRWPLTYEISLTTFPACITKPCGTSNRHYTCGGRCVTQAAQTCDNLHVGYLTSTAPGTPVYQEPLGCGGDLTTVATCPTKICNDSFSSTTLYWNNCNGTGCTSTTPVTCPTGAPTPVGYIPP